ncbi:MAG: hypothetical protein WCC64_08175 [Aliidongia sp.]
MRKSLFVISTAFAVVWGAASASEVPPFNFNGQWRVDSIVGYSAVSASQDGVDPLIGQRIDISNSGLKIAANQCKAESMQAALRDTEPLLLSEYRARRQDVGLPAKTLTLSAQPCGYVFRSGQDIVFSQDGAFYRASRVTN